MTDIEKLQQMFDEGSVVFFGGAGVSTESGIPDFRSKDGLYNQKDIRFDRYSPEYLLSHSCLYQNAKVFFEFYRQKLDVRGIQPNAAHYKLAELEAAGKLDCVITQNIDGLHQLAGSKKVYEIHGTTQKNYCDRCRRSYPADYILDNTEAIPRCSCGGMIRPDVTLYEESLPDEAWSRSAMAISRAKTLIIAGTSLAVYPAASLIDYFSGDNLVIINLSATGRDRYANLVIQEKVGEVFSRIKA